MRFDDRICHSPGRYIVVPRLYCQPKLFNPACIGRGQRLRQMRHFRLVRAADHLWIEWAFSLGPLLPGLPGLFGALCGVSTIQIIDSHD